MKLFKTIKQQKVVRALFGVICIWLLLIFFLSTQNGTDTANTSGRIAQAIARVFYGSSDPMQINAIHMEIRRLAHVVLFLILGSMIGLACIKVNMTTPVWIRFLFGYGFLLFCSFFDEWHKQFISGRHNQFGDALLNVRGSTIGLGIIIIIYVIKRVWKGGRR